MVEEVTPDVVINCAGKTGRPNVDWCEDHKEETVRANVTGPLILLDECRKQLEKYKRPYVLIGGASFDERTKNAIAACQKILL